MRILIAGTILFLMFGAQISAKELPQTATVKVSSAAVRSGWDDNMSCDGGHCTGDVTPTFDKVTTYTFVTPDGAHYDLHGTVGNGLSSMFKTDGEYQVSYQEEHHFGQLKDTQYIAVTLNGKTKHFYYLKGSETQQPR